MGKMKILWISSAPIGPISRVLGLPYGGSSGTWIQSEYESLMEYVDSIEMYYLCPVKTISRGHIIENSTKEGHAYGIGYNPKISFGKVLPSPIITEIEKIIRKINPDLIHIWGSESSFSATVATLCPEYPKVIFIQGLIGIHYRYMQPHYLREKQYLGRVSIGKYLKRLLKRNYYGRHIALEQKAIAATVNIITDNSFTKAYCDSFASPRYYNHFLYPNGAYYRNRWNLQEAQRNSIFTVFAGDPSKGLAQLLKAVTIVRNRVPDIKLYIPGPFTLDSTKKIDKKHCSDFERWVYNYISANNLWQNVFFTGRLGLDEMIENYLSCNLFVSPSCMEVHASSVREAMALGVPTISSLCGSVIDTIQHNKNGLIYRFEEEEVLAMQILRVLCDKEFAQNLGYEAWLSMAKENGKGASLFEIYKTIIQ